MPANQDSATQATEVSYALHSLGWKAFQALCTTITSDIWGQTIQAFCDSHDGGRDGAFHGKWTTEKGESLSGAFTAQCKFTSSIDKKLRVSDLTDELSKAKRLAAKGLADNYVLFTNADVTGIEVENIEAAFRAVPGIKHCVVLGRARITQMIRETPRLRMLVPRVYGLGDLSQILDARAYEQSKEILSLLGDDLGKFVITEPYRRAANALMDHGFVLLLGEPASGKSTIAAALALGALDQWGCSTLRVRSADEFVKHSNPHESRQFFWIDDAFGTTQLENELVADWNRILVHVQAAIRRGAKVLLTSRDYIYKGARMHLKESAFPLLRESQVVIEVAGLCGAERRQILYNHIRLGRQDREFKRAIKPFLAMISAHPRFVPEIARRLGDPAFTRQLVLGRDTLREFVEHPIELLKDIVRTLDSNTKAALAIVFMRGGSVSSPVDVSSSESRALELLGSSSSAARSAMAPLDGSLLLSVIEGGAPHWRFKHPTIRDAFAAVVAEDQELLDIYLAGAPVATVLSEVSCGDLGVPGVKVIVSQSRHSVFAARLVRALNDREIEHSRFIRFLAFRCDRSFLKEFLATESWLLPSLNVMSYILATPHVQLLAKLSEFGLLEEEIRMAAVEKIANLAVETPDSGFLAASVAPLFTEAERAGILARVRSDLLSRLGQVVDEWRSGYRHASDPGTYFSDLTEALSDYRVAFDGDEAVVLEIDGAISAIDQIVQELADEDEPDHDDGEYFDSDDGGSDTTERSIFDDVDDM